MYLITTIIRIPYFPLHFKGFCFIFRQILRKVVVYPFREVTKTAYFGYCKTEKYRLYYQVKRKAAFSGGFFDFSCRNFQKILHHFPDWCAHRRGQGGVSRSARTGSRVPLHRGEQEHALSACPPVQDGPRAGIRQRVRRVSGAPRLMSTNRRAGAQGEAARAQPSAAGGQRVGRRARVGAAAAALAAISCRGYLSGFGAQRSKPQRSAGLTPCGLSRCKPRVRPAPASQSAPHLWRAWRRGNGL